MLYVVVHDCRNLQGERSCPHGKDHSADADEEEVQTRWGHTNPYKEAQRRTKGYSKEDWERIKAANNDLMARLAGLLGQGESADGDEAMDLAEAHRLHFDRSYYPCSHAMHAGLADMYESDALWVQHRQARRRISGVSGGRDPRQREAPVEVNHKRKGPKSTRRAACCANRTNARATGGW